MASPLHHDVLSPEQCSILPLLKQARKRSFYMVGGTAIALHIGHRKSIDFDLFLSRTFTSSTIRSIMEAAWYTWDALHVRQEHNMTGIISNVKFTFFSFPFVIVPTVDYDGYIKIPDILTLAAMKAYAMGRRAKWKDYVDLYFILRDYHSISEISARASEIFAGNFNSRQFREQLAYHEDINYAEPVEYLIPDPPTDTEVKRFLLEKAIED